MPGLPGVKEEQCEPTRKPELLENLAAWTLDSHEDAQSRSKYLKELQNTQKYSKVNCQKNTDIKSQDVTLTNDDHHVLSILQQAIEPKQAMLCNIDIDKLCSFDL